MPTLAEIVAEYVPSRLGLAASTARQYTYVVSQFSQWLGRPAISGDFTEKTVLAFLNFRHAAHKAHWTVKRERATLLTLWRYATRKGYCPPPPDIPTVKVPRRIPVAWRVDELQQLLAQCGELQSNLGDTGIARSAWWSSLLLFLYSTGCRIGQAMQLRPESVDLPTGRVILPADSSKTGVEQICILLTSAGGTSMAASGLSAGKSTALPYVRMPYCAMSVWRLPKRPLIA